MNSDAKIPVPAFIKLLSSNDVPVAKAMAATGKLYKDYSTPALLAQLTDVKLKAAGVDDKEDRKLVLAALRKAGYTASASSSSARKRAPAMPQKKNGESSKSGAMSTVETVTTPVSKKKRKRDDENELLPSAPRDEASAYGSMEFNELLDEEQLQTKSTVVNRAPLMTAWATVVAERLGFQREEALSIASVYTELNAISKGVSLGIFKAEKQNGMEASRSGAQPYVDIMGRRVPLFQTQNGQWRALSSNTPAQPSSAFSYISRAFRQTTPHVIGALRLLAASFGPGELNAKGFALYADFRPAVDGWGKRGEVSCRRILELRRPPGERAQGAGGEAAKKGDVVKTEPSAEGDAAKGADVAAEPQSKKAKAMTLEDYENALDADETFNELDLSELS